MSHGRIRTIDDLKRDVFKPAEVTLPQGYIVSVNSIPKSKGIEFGQRLEAIEHIGGMFDVVSDMIVATVDIDGIDADAAFALLHESGGMRGELMKAVGRKCGLGDVVEVFAASLDRMGNAEIPGGKRPEQ